MPNFVSHGHILYYREQGDGPLLIILPGNTASSACHEGDLQHFGARYHALSIDLLGTGQSDRLEDWPVNWWELGGRDAVALIEHLNEPGAILVGTSGGAAAALWAAILFPDRVRAVIADSIVPFDPPAMLRREVENRQARTPEQVGFWQFAQGEDWEAVVEADNQLLLKFADSGGDYFGGRLSEISCPVMFSLSLTDSVLYEVGRQSVQMAAQVPGSRLFLLNRGNHPLMWSCSEDFYTAADGFLSLIK